MPLTSINSTALRARLAALTEVHEYYEFDATTEADFDEWLHEKIKACRAEMRQTEHGDDVSDT